MLLGILSSIVHSHLTRNSYISNLAQWKRIFCVCIVIITKEKLKQKRNVCKQTPRSLVVQELKLICKAFICPSEHVQKIQFSIQFSTVQSHGGFFPLWLLSSGKYGTCVATQQPLS